MIFQEKKQSLWFFCGLSYLLCLTLNWRVFSYTFKRHKMCTVPSADTAGEQQMIYFGFHKAAPGGQGPVPPRAWQSWELLIVYWWHEWTRSTDDELLFMRDKNSFNSVSLKDCGGRSWVSHFFLPLKLPVCLDSSRKMDPGLSLILFLYSHKFPSAEPKWYIVILLLIDWLIDTVIVNIAEVGMRPLILRL